MESCFILFLIVPLVGGLSVSLIEKDIHAIETQSLQNNHDLEHILRHQKFQKQVEAVKNEVYRFSAPHSVDQREKAKGCSCVGSNCGCCVHVDIEVIGLDSEVCVNVSYIPAPEYGVSVSLTIGGKTIINETISARNPPPLCVDVPELKQLASVCLKFSNLTVTSKSFSGCLSLQARLAKVIHADVPLGCFKIPPGGATKDTAATPLRRIMKGKQLTVLQDTIVKGRPLGFRQKKQMQYKVDEAKAKTIR